MCKIYNICTHAKSTTSGDLNSQCSICFERLIELRDKYENSLRYTTERDHAYRLLMSYLSSIEFILKKK